MIAAPAAPAGYPFVEVHFGRRIEHVRFVCIPLNTDPDAVSLDLLRDAIADQQTVCFAAQDRTSLELASMAFRRLLAEVGGGTVEMRTRPELH